MEVTPPKSLRESSLRAKTRLDYHMLNGNKARKNGHNPDIRRPLADMEANRKDSSPPTEDVKTLDGSQCHTPDKKAKPAGVQQSTKPKTIKLRISNYSTLGASKPLETPARSENGREIRNPEVASKIAQENTKPGAITGRVSEQDMIRGNKGGFLDINTNTANQATTSPESDDVDDVAKIERTTSSTSTPDGDLQIIQFATNAAAKTKRARKSPTETGSSRSLLWLAPKTGSRDPQKGLKLGRKNLDELRHDLSLQMMPGNSSQDLVSQPAPVFEGGSRPSMKSVTRPPTNSERPVNIHPPGVQPKPFLHVNDPGEGPSALPKKRNYEVMVESPSTVGQTMVGQPRPSKKARNSTTSNSTVPGDENQAPIDSHNISRPQQYVRKSIESNRTSKVNTRRSQPKSSGRNTVIDLTSDVVPPQVLAYLQSQASGTPTCLEPHVPTVLSLPPPFGYSSPLNQHMIWGPPELTLPPPNPSRFGSRKLESHHLALGSRYKPVVPDVSSSQNDRYLAGRPLTNNQTMRLYDIILGRVDWRDETMWGEAGIQHVVGWRRIAIEKFMMSEIRDKVWHVLDQDE